MTKPVKNYRVLVLRKNLKGWKLVTNRAQRKFTKARADQIVAILRKKGRTAKVKKITIPTTNNAKLIKKWLRGDLDFDRNLMIKLAKAARDSKTVLYVNYGKRTRAEQQALWNKYGPPRAAKPGHSRHETGLAADVVTRRTRRNVGDVKRVRAALRINGLCLPVSGEPWHCESGSVWRA